MTRNIIQNDDDHEVVLDISSLSERASNKLRRRRSFASQRRQRFIEKTWVVAMAAPPLDIKPLKRAIGLDSDQVIAKRQEEKDGETITTVDDSNSNSSYAAVATPSCNVTLLIPWIEDSRERKKLYGSDSIRWDDGSLGRWQQTAFIRQWAREKLNIEDEITDGLRIRFYPAHQANNDDKNCNDDFFYDACPVSLDVLQKLKEEEEDNASSYDDSSSDEDEIITTRVKIICMDLQGQEKEFMLVDDKLIQSTTAATENISISNKPESRMNMYLHEKATKNSGGGTNVPTVVDSSRSTAQSLSIVPPESDVSCISMNDDSPISKAGIKLQPSPVQVEILHPYQHDSSGRNHNRARTSPAYLFSSSQPLAIPSRRFRASYNILLLLQMAAWNVSILFGLFALWFVLIDERYLVLLVS